MANTITAFNTFVAGTRAQASEVNTNFSNFRGDLIPINENTITASDNSHDLGTTDHRWKDLLLAGTITPSAEKTSLLMDDEFLIRDSADSNTLKNIKSSNFFSKVCLYDAKAISVDGGAASAETNHARVLNQGIGDITAMGMTFPVDGTATIGGSNTQFTLTSGTYMISWKVPGFDCDRSHAGLYNVTDSTMTGNGSGSYLNATTDVATHVFGQWIGTINTTTTFRIDQWTLLGKATNGLGLAAYLTTTSNATLNIFTVCTIERYS